MATAAAGPVDFRVRYSDRASLMTAALESPVISVVFSSSVANLPLTWTCTCILTLSVSEGIKLGGVDTGSHQALGTASRKGRAFPHVSTKVHPWFTEEGPSKGTSG